MVTSFELLFARARYASSGEKLIEAGLDEFAGNAYEIPPVNCPPITLKRETSLDLLLAVARYDALFEKARSNGNNEPEGKGKDIALLSVLFAFTVNNVISLEL